MDIIKQRVIYWNIPIIGVHLMITDVKTSMIPFRNCGGRIKKIRKDAKSWKYTGTVVGHYAEIELLTNYCQKVDIPVFIDMNDFKRDALRINLYVSE